MNKKIYDVTGVLRDGMWHYAAPFPEYKLLPLPEVPWVKGRVYCEIFSGLNSQCGTYLETPAHYFGNDKCYLLNDVGISRLFELPVTLIMLDGIGGEAGDTQEPKNGEEAPKHGTQAPKRVKITVDMLKSALGNRKIDEGEAIIIGCGWGKYWFDENYLTSSPYFSLEAMKWLVEKKPFLIGSDIPCWENNSAPEGIFPVFYGADILMLAPLVSLESIEERDGLRLTALPIKADGTSCAPCRAIISVDLTRDE